MVKFILVQKEYWSIIRSRGKVKLCYKNTRGKAVMEALIFEQKSIGNCNDLKKTSTTKTTCCCPKMFKCVASGFSEANMATIDEMGFGGVCKLACPLLFRSLCSFIAANFDLDEKLITVYKKSMKIRLSDFERIMGCKDSGCNVKSRGWDKKSGGSTSNEVYVGKVEGYGWGKFGKELRKQ